MGDICRAERTALFTHITGSVAETAQTSAANRQPTVAGDAAAAAVGTATSSNQRSRRTGVDLEEVASINNRVERNALESNRCVACAPSKDLCLRRPTSANDIRRFERLLLQLLLQRGRRTSSVDAATNSPPSPSRSRRRRRRTTLAPGSFVKLQNVEDDGQRFSPCRGRRREVK